MKMRFSKTVKWMLLLLITAGLSWFITANRGDFRFLLDIKYEYLPILLFLHVIYLALISFRYYLTMRAITDKVGLWKCCKYFVVGRFLNKITPQGGILYRALSFKKRNNIGYDKYFSSFFAFVWIDFVFSLLTGAIIIAIYNPAFCIGTVNGPGVFIALFLLSILTLPVLGAAAKLLHLSQKPTRRGKVFSFIKRTADSFFLMMRNKRLFLKSSILILLNFLAGAGIIYFCFKSIDIDTSLPAIAVFLVLTKLGNVITVIPGNFGVREFLYGFLAETMGIGIAQGISASLILRVSVFLVQGFISFVFILGDKFEKEAVSSNRHDSLPPAG